MGPNLNAIKQNAALAAQGLIQVKSHLGQHEATGRNDGPYVDSLEAWMYGPTKSNTEAPWCAIERSKDSFDAANILKIERVLPKTDSSTFLYGWAKQHNLLLDTPIPGCIGLIKAPAGSGKTHEHTFRVETVDLVKGVVHSADGNWANSVCETVHPISNCNFVVEC